MNESHGKILNDLSEYCRAASWQIEELKTLRERRDMLQSISSVLHKGDRDLRDEMQRLNEGEITLTMSMETARYLATAVGTVGAMLVGMKIDVTDWANDDEKRYEGRKAMSILLAKLFDADKSLQRLCSYYEDEDLPF